MSAQRRSPAQTRNAPPVEILYEFIRPNHTGVDNRDIIPIVFLFFVISLADVQTTVAFLSLGGREGNTIVRTLIGAYGMGVLFPFKYIITGFLALTILFFWKVLGIEPRRFFWPLVLMTLVTVSIVLSNIAYIFSLL